MATNDEVILILNYLLSYQPAPLAETRRFSRWRHNRDCCTQLAQKLDKILQKFDFQRSLAYDIQGLRDAGTDVILRLGEEDKVGYVGFQVKAENELGEKGLLDKLRSQYVQSRAAYEPLLQYFVVPFADEINQRDNLRNIAQAFVKELDVRVVSPAYLATFLTLPDTRVDAYIRSVIGEDDFVFRNAQADVSAYTPLEVALLILLMEEYRRGNADGLTAEEVLNDGFFQDCLSAVPDLPREGFFADGYESQDYELVDVWEDLDPVAASNEEPVPDDFYDRQRPEEERLSEVLDQLEDDIGMTGVRYGYIAGTHVEVFALLTDGAARWGHEGRQLADYLADLLGVGEQYLRARLDHDVS